MEWTSYLIAAPARLLYLGLLVFALRQWAVHHESPHLDRRLWLFIIVILSIVGPAAYLALSHSMKPRNGSTDGGIASIYTNWEPHDRPGPLGALGLQRRRAPGIGAKAELPGPRGDVVTGERGNDGMLVPL